MTTFTTLFVTVLMLAAANARFKTVWEDDDDPFYSPGMSYRYISPLQLPQPPQLPGFPPIRLPSPPPLLWPGNVPQPPVVSFPPFPKLPTVEDIMKQQSEAGSNVVGGAVFSSSSSTRDKDGKIIRKGGSTIMTNDNGKVVVTQVGDEQPVKIYTKDNNSKPLSVSDTPKFKPFEPFTFKPFKMEPFHMDPFDFKPIEPISVDSIKNHVPQKGETFTGSSHSTYSFSNDDNGKKSSGGSAQSVVNDNGNVDERNLAFKKDPK